jgi:hypothetical protein
MNIVQDDDHVLSKLCGTKRDDALLLNVRDEARWDRGGADGAKPIAGNGFAA